MSGIILPGQQNMSPQQIEAINRKQKMLALLRKWEAFVNSDTADEVLESDIGVSITANIDRFIAAFPNAVIGESDRQDMVLKLHGGSHILLAEQMAMKEAMEAKGQKIPDEAILMTVAQVITFVEGIALHDPQVTSNPMFRAFALAIELGFVKTQVGPADIPEMMTNPTEPPPEEKIPLAE